VHLHHVAHVDTGSRTRQDLMTARREAATSCPRCAQHVPFRRAVGRDPKAALGPHRVVVGLDEPSAPAVGSVVYTCPDVQRPHLARSVLELLTKLRPYFGPSSTRRKACRTLTTQLTSSILRIICGDSDCRKREMPATRNSRRCSWCADRRVGSHECRARVWQPRDTGCARGSASNAGYTAMVEGPTPAPDPNAGPSFRRIPCASQRSTPADPSRTVRGKLTATMSRMRSLLVPGCTQAGTKGEHHGQVLLLKHYRGAPAAVTMSRWTAGAPTRSRPLGSDDLSARLEAARVRRRAALSPDGVWFRYDGDGPPPVTDGPFAETKDLIAGWMVIDVDSYERAIELAR